MLNADNMVCCRISSPTIKRLIVNLDYYDDESDCRVEINAPALRFLMVDDQSSKHIEVGALTSLTEADISLSNYHDKRDDFLYSRSVMEFFDRLCNVEYLRLEFLNCREIVDSAFSALAVKFHNLTNLELIAERRFLWKFLEIADNLEILTFREVNPRYKGLMEPQLVPTSYYHISEGCSSLGEDGNT